MASAASRQPNEPINENSAWSVGSQEWDFEAGDENPWIYDILVGQSGPFSWFFNISRGWNRVETAATVRRDRLIMIIYDVPESEKIIPNLLLLFRKYFLIYL